MCVQCNNETSESAKTGMLLPCDLIFRHNDDTFLLPGITLVMICDLCQKAYIYIWVCGLIKASLPDIWMHYYNAQVKNTGSWMEIGNSISHFGIVSAQVVFVLLLFALTNLYTRTIRVKPLSTSPSLKTLWEMVNFLWQKIVANQILVRSGD